MTHCSVFSVPVEPEPEKGCSIEVVVLAASEERERVEVLENIKSALPPNLFPEILPTPESGANSTNDTEYILPTLYSSLVEEFDERHSESGYSKFVEAVTEITQAYSEACSGPPASRVQSTDIPRLVQEYVTLKNSSANLEDLRRVFGKILCIHSEASGRKRRGTLCPDPCTCPAGGLKGGDFLCVCQFFRCLDPNDDWQPLFGFVYDIGQSLGFVVDTTGSMGDEIAAAKQVITNLIASEENVDVLAYVLTPYNDWDDLIYDTDLPSMFLFYHYLPLYFMYVSSPCRRWTFYCCLC